MWSLDIWGDGFLVRGGGTLRISLQKLRVDISGDSTGNSQSPDPIARATVSYIDIIREPQEKENGQTVISDDLSVLAPLVGLEPTTP